MEIASPRVGFPPFRPASIVAAFPVEERSATLGLYRFQCAIVELAKPVTVWTAERPFAVADSAPHC
jgi:hypothetical protein